jgi:diamine N-acetyltransferase
MVKKRISLVKFRLSFLKTTPYIEWLKQYENIKYIGREELFKKIRIPIIRKYLIENIKSKRTFMFLILNEKKVPIGTAKLGNIDWYHKRADVGIMIHYDFRAKGYASEAISFLIDFSFKKLGLNKLVGGCENRNFLMKNVFIKTNFKLEGIQKKHSYAYDKKIFIDHAIYGLVK